MYRLFPMLIKAERYYIKGLITIGNIKFILFYELRSLL